MHDKRIDAETGERKRFCSEMLPPWCRKSPKICEVLAPALPAWPSSGEFVRALEQVLGSSAGLSPAAVTRLTQQWQADHAAFMASFRILRDLLDRLEDSATGALRPEELHGPRTVISLAQSASGRCRRTSCGVEDTLGGVEPAAGRVGPRRPDGGVATQPDHHC